MNATLSATRSPDAPAGPAASVRTASFQARNLLLDEAYEEFCARQERGELVNVASFCERYQAVKSSLRRVIDAHLFLDNSPALAAKTKIAWPEVGTSLLGFELEAELGRGSFSRVYLARQPELGNRRVVVKLTPYATREAGFLGRLNHPGIVPVHSIERVPDAGFSAICMPYLGAATVDDLLDNAYAAWSTRAGGLPAAVGRSRCDPLPAHSATDAQARKPGTFEDAVVELACQVLSALDHAHQQGIVHGDLKPSNILLTPAGRALLIDFNLAAEAQADEGLVGGTLFYMAPERLAQLRQADNEAKAGGRPPLSPRADLYSLGVVLYQLLTGRLPFDDSNAGSLPLHKLAERLLAKQEKADQSRATSAGATDRALLRIVRKAMRFQPEERYGSAAEMLAELHNWRSAPRRGARWIGQHKFTVAAAALTLVIGLGTASYHYATLPPLHVRLANQASALTAGGDFKSAIARLTEAIRLERDNPDYFFARGRAYMLDGDFVQARTDFQEVVNRQPNSGRAYAALGYCYCLGNSVDVDMAHRFNCDAVKNGFESAELYHNIGVCLFISAMYDKAIPWFNKAITLNPKLPISYYYLARAQFNLSQGKSSYTLNDAAENVEKAISLVKCHGLHEFAAQVYCMLARKDARAADRAYFHISQAVAYGANAESFRKNSVIAKLGNEKALMEAIATPLREKTCALPSDFIDPLK
jgi:serine/threonine protein kinase/Tfp pilus assembly protein PilF